MSRYCKDCTKFIGCNETMPDSLPSFCRRFNAKDIRSLPITCYNCIHKCVCIYFINKTNSHCGITMPTEQYQVFNIMTVCRSCEMMADCAFYNADSCPNYKDK